MARGRGRLPGKQNIMLMIFWYLLTSCSFCPSARSADITGLPLQGKPTSQSSTYEGVTSDLAVDGDSTPDYYSNTCSHTARDVHPWWMLDLEKTHCLGNITLVNRGDCCSKRLTGATVRVGLNANYSQNEVCGSPVTEAQASIPGGHVSFMCDPPVAARYVSVDIDAIQPKVLTLCEVFVHEFPMAQCMKTKEIRTSCGFKLLQDGACVKNPRPLSTIVTKSLMPCTFECKQNANCWSFDYAPTTGRCRLYNEGEEDLVPDSELGCVVYAVVGCSLTADENMCTDST